MTSPESPSHPAPSLQSLPPVCPLPPRTFSEWIRVFGPGAILASLTIGSGELVFSSRGGALFGYPLLCYFGLVLVLKWALVYGSARHIILSGAHPFERCMHLSGPRGWFPTLLIVMAVLCFPIWVYFHSSVIGSLLAWLIPWNPAGSATFLVWAILVLLAMIILTFQTRYKALELIQTVIVCVMLVAVLASVFMLNPDWGDALKGFLVPASLQYPPWASAYPEIVNRPLWVELITYVGVIGGSSFDYLAYTAYVREKGWGQAASGTLSAEDLKSLQPSTIDHSWLRVAALDCTFSFLAVLIFSAAFVIAGHLVLGSQGKVPDGTNLLNLQAEFMSPIAPGLQWLYFAGAFLAMLGTLYGTIEVAPAIGQEFLRAMHVHRSAQTFQRTRFVSIGWTTTAALFLLLAHLGYVSWRGPGSVPGLLTVLTPANLFTGVLGCGLLCLVNIWMDRRFHPPSRQMGRTLTALNGIAAVIFLAIGAKGYWDYAGWNALTLFAGTVAVGFLTASKVARFLRNPRP